MAENVSDAGFVEDFTVLLSGEETRDEGVDADVAVGPLTSDVPGEVMDSGLRSGVGEDAREWVEPRDGAEIDDRGWNIAAEKVVPEDLAGAKDADEIDIEDAKGFFICDFYEWSGGVDACTINEDVDLP